MSKSISEIDKNLAVETVANLPVQFVNVLDGPFNLYGLCDPRDGGAFHRIPQEVADATNEGVKWLNLHTSGGRVRFKTDSPYVALHVEMSDVSRMDHMAFTGVYGFDMYIYRGGEYVYLGTFRPTVDMKGGFEVLSELPGGMCEIMIHMPLFNHHSGLNLIQRILAVSTLMWRSFMLLSMKRQVFM